MRRESRTLVERIVSSKRSLRWVILVGLVALGGGCTGELELSNEPDEDAQQEDARDGDAAPQLDAREPESDADAEAQSPEPDAQEPAEDADDSDAQEPAEPDSCADDDCDTDCRDPSTWPKAWADFEAEVILLANERRAEGASCGNTEYPATTPLVTDDAAREAARCHSLDMASNNFFEHTSSNGDELPDRAAEAGFEAGTQGENIGAALSSPTKVIENWMGSPEHCKNIMRESFTRVGVGLVSGNDAGLSTQYNMYWTMNLGSD